MIVRGKREILSKINKIRIGFISIFLLKARVSYLTILKRKNLSLPLRTDKFVICLVLPECLSVKFAFYPRTVKRIVTALMPSFLFHFFYLFLPHLRTLAQRKGRKIVPHFLLTNCSQHDKMQLFAKFKKILAKLFAHAISARVHHRDLEHACVTEFDCVALLAML